MVVSHERNPLFYETILLFGWNVEREENTQLVSAKIPWCEIFILAL